MAALRIALVATLMVLTSFALAAPPASAADLCDNDGLVQACFIVCVTEPCDGVQVCVNPPEQERVCV